MPASPSSHQSSSFTSTGSLPIDPETYRQQMKPTSNCYHPCKTLPSMLKSVHPFVTFPHCLACILQSPGAGTSGLRLSLDLPSLQFIQGQVLVVLPLQTFPPGSFFLTFTPAPSVGPGLSYLCCCNHLLTGPLLPAPPPRSCHPGTLQVVLSTVLSAPHKSA